MSDSIKLIYRYEPGTAQPQSQIHVSTFLNEMNKDWEKHSGLLYGILFPEVMEKDGVLYAINMDLIREHLQKH